MQDLLITGATGFIASHLLPILAAQDYQITAATRRDFTFSELSKVSSVKVGEIDGETDWRQALQGIDIVIHLAARAHILQDTATDAAAEFQRVNTIGTANLVQQAVAAGVKHFILVSSIGAMTTLSSHILTEKSPCQPDTPYGKSKLEAELALQELAQNSEMTWTILRPTLVYGAGNPGNMDRLIKLVKSGLPLPLGAINNRRSFLYVGNLVDAIARIISHPLSHGQTFLVSDGEDVSTPELIRLLAETLAQPCQLLPIPSTLLAGLAGLGTTWESWTGISTPFNRGILERLKGSLYVDISHIQQTLDWHPPYTLNQGLQLTLFP